MAILMKPKPQPAAKPKNTGKAGNKKEKEIITTDQLLKIKCLENNTILTNTGNYIQLLSVPGEDYQMKSFEEQNFAIRRIAGVLATIEENTSFYAHSRPLNTQPLLARLTQDRRQEKNPKIIEQNYIESNFLEIISKENNLAERNYWLAVQARPGEIKRAAELANMQDESAEGEDGPKKKSFIDVLKYGVNGSPAPAEGKGKEKTTSIDPVLASQLGFKSKAVAAQFGGQQLATNEIENLLIETFSGQAPTPAPASSSAGQESTSFTQRLAALNFEEHPDYIKVGKSYVTSLYITEIPKNVNPAQIEDLLNIPGLDIYIGVHNRPWGQAEAAKKLTNKQGLLLAAEQGRSDPKRRQRLGEVTSLLNGMARDNSRLFRLTIAIAVRADSQKKLAYDRQTLIQKLREKGFESATCSRFQLRGFLSAIPLGECHIWSKYMLDRTQHPNLPGEIVSCLLPNCVATSSNEGILLGISPNTGKMVFYERWAGEESPHTVVIASTGGGKTVAQKIEIIREALRDKFTGAWLLDPQDGITLPELLGGIRVDLSTSGNVVINPIDRYVIDGAAEPLGDRIIFLRALVTLMLQSELTATLNNAVAQALKKLYYHFELGETALHTIEETFKRSPEFAAIAATPERLPWIMAELRQIYADLTKKYRIPNTGFIRGKANQAQLQPERPICYYSEADNRYYYKGEGTTSEPFSELPENPDPFWQKPAEVWHPDPTWYRELKQEFTRIVQEKGLFEGLPKAGLYSAIQTTFLELRAGMPILSDWFPFLIAEGALNLVTNLQPFTDPEIFGRCFNGFTNIPLNHRIIVFNILKLDDGLLRPVRIFQVLNLCWGRAKAQKSDISKRVRRILICDEFGVLSQNFKDVAEFFRDMYMRGRAFFLSLCIIVQNLTSLVDSQAALQCLENAGRLVLLRQQSAAIPRLKAYFRLTEKQCEILLAAKKGESLQRINGQWVHVQYKLAPEQLTMFDRRYWLKRESENEKAGGD